MDLIQYKTKEPVGRDEAAKRLRQLADDLTRHNEVRFERDGKHYTVDGPDDVKYSIEIEVGEHKSEIELKLKWSAPKS